MAAAKTDTVKIKIPRDRTDPKNDSVTVVVNGRYYRIKRGEEVEVPAIVAEVLDHAEAATDAYYESIGQ